MPALDSLAVLGDGLGPKGSLLSLVGEVGLPPLCDGKGMSYTHLVGAGQDPVRRRRLSHRARDSQRGEVESEGVGGRGGGGADGGGRAEAEGEGQG